MAFSISKCALRRRGEPSLHFIRAAVRCRRDPPPPAIRPPAFVSPNPLLPPSLHTHPHPERRAWGRGGGGSRFPAAGRDDRTDPGRAGSPSFYVRGDTSRPHRGAGRSDLCPLTGPVPWWPRSRRVNSGWEPS